MSRESDRPNLQIVLRVARWRICPPVVFREAVNFGCIGNLDNSANEGNAILTEVVFINSTDDSAQLLKASCRSFLSRKHSIRFRERDAFLDQVARKNAEMGEMFVSQRKLITERNLLAGKRWTEEIAVLYAMTNHHLASTKVVPGVLCAIRSPYRGVSMDELLNEVHAVSWPFESETALQPVPFSYSALIRQSKRISGL